MISLRWAAAAAIPVLGVGAIALAMAIGPPWHGGAAQALPLTSLQPSVSPRSTATAATTPPSAPPPSEVPSPDPATTLLAISGAGAASSRDVALTGRLRLHVTYRYDCTAMHGPGRFSVTLRDLASGEPVDALVGDIGVSGEGWTEPTEGAGRYRVDVDSPCRWAIDVGMAAAK